jgi:hypothetical protein
MMSDEGLFALPPGSVVVPSPPPAADPVSAGRKLTAKQKTGLRRGKHPLGGRLHSEAAPANDRAAPGRRCGNCRHRNPAAGSRGYPKCMISVITSGAATDCRAWWPACTRYEPPEEGSPS